MRLTAADGLSVDVAANGTVKVGLDGQDWFGPGRSSLPSSVGAPVTAFQASYPNVRVQILVTERMVDLIAEGVDLAFRLGALKVL